MEWIIKAENPPEGLRIEDRIDETGHFYQTYRGKWTVFVSTALTYKTRAKAEAKAFFLIAKHPELMGVIDVAEVNAEMRRLGLWVSQSEAEEAGL